MPKLSVLMPVRNGGRFLMPALRSTLKALPRDSELLVFNDGSTDNTTSDLASVACRQLKVWHHTESVGIVQALNTLLQESDSEHVARMDADDVCLPWRFVCQQRAIARADFLFTSVVFVNEFGRPLRPDFPGFISAAAVPLHLLLGNFLVHPTMFAKRQSLFDFGAYRSSQAEDYDLWLRVAAGGGKIERLPEPGLLYRSHKNQVSVTGDWKSRGSDPVLEESYARLAEQAIGFTGDSSALRLACIDGVKGGIDPAESRAFTKAMITQSGELSTIQQLLLRGRLGVAKRRWLGVLPTDVRTFGVDK